jgi:pyruvate dehydrogenase E1 component beta subunit
MIEAINLALKQEMKKNRKMILIGEDIGENGGVFRVTEGLSKIYKERVIDSPLAESGIIGTCIGMSLTGIKPVAEIQFEGFMAPAFDQIISHVSRIRNRSRGRFSCPIVIRSPIGGGIRALEHHSDSPETYLLHTPGIKVVIPSTPYDAKGLLISSLREKDPVVFFEPKKLYRAIKEEVPEKEYTIPLGQAKIVKEGKDITLITYGSSVKTCSDLINKIEDVSVELIDLRTLCPLDINTIISSVKKTGKAVIVHEAPKTLGFASELIALINEKALFSLQAPIERVTGYDIPVPLPKQEDYYLINEKRIINAIKKVMQNAL